MLSSLELRFAESLRNKIQEEIDSYPLNLEAVNDFASFRKEQGFYEAYRNVLDMIEEIQQKLAE